MRLQDIITPQVVIDNPNFYKEKIKFVQDLLATNPGVNDPELTQEWLATFRSHVIELITYYGKLKTDYTRFSVSLLTQMSNEDFKKFCKTEAHTENYIAAHFPWMEELNTLKPIIEKYFPQVSSEYITLISASKKQTRI